MLTNAFYTTLAVGLRGPGERPATFFVAVGAGDRRWDEAGPPRGTRDVEKLADEVARREVRLEDVVFLDEEGEPTKSPAPRLRVSVTFGPREATGTLRECGLFGGDATAETGSGTLLSYFAHLRIDKDERMELARSLRLDLTPRPVAAGSRETRWLGNSSTMEVHDRERLTSRCQVGEIRFDRRYFFSSPEEALEAGYDRCAFCFGRELSRR